MLLWTTVWIRLGTSNRRFPVDGKKRSGDLVSSGNSVGAFFRTGDVGNGHGDHVSRKRASRVACAGGIAGGRGESFGTFTVCLGKVDQGFDYGLIVARREKKTGCGGSGGRGRRKRGEVVALDRGRAGLSSVVPKNKAYRLCSIYVYVQVHLHGRRLVNIQRKT